MIWNRRQADELERCIHNATDFSHTQAQTTEIDSLIQLAHALEAIPKKSAPVPRRARTYLLVEQPEHVKAGLKLIRLSSYMGGATLVIGLALTTVFAANAHPGSPLYAYKLKGEQIRLHFTTNPESKLDLQLSLVENRIKDTQNALNDSTIDTATKVAALQELTTQTKAAVEAAKEVAVAQKNPTVLDKIEQLTQSQVKVLTQSPDTTNKELGLDALAAAQENSKTIAATKLLVAASQESDITNLPANTQTIKGAITAISYNQITVDDITFTTTDQTDIKYSKPETKDSKVDVKVGQMVSVVAIKTGKTLTAQTIIIVPTPGKVKGSTDAKNDGIIDTKDTIPTPSEVLPETEKVQSGFQVENPSPLYPSNP